jgi:perosamine synthetase
MIQIYKPFLNKNITKFAHEAIDSTWISSQGYYLDAAKEKLKELLGVKYVILTNNGTTATHLLSKSIESKNKNIKKIICPNNVYVAAWNSFLYDKNFELIPIDSDLNTWNIDLKKIEEIQEDEAFLIVHNLGNIINVPELKLKYPNTLFVEDNCEGFLGKYNGKYSGTESLCSSVSFFGNKTITSGEGGCFITNDDDIFQYINNIRNQGQSDVKFIHNNLGYNYRMTNIQAALLYGQLLHIDEIIEKKKIVFERYYSNLNNLENVFFQKKEENTEHSNWMFSIGFNNLEETEKIKLQHFLFDKKIETRTMFYEIKKHSHLMNLDCETTCAEKLNKEVLLLPSYPDLTINQVDYICESIKKFFV